MPTPEMETDVIFLYKNKSSLLENRQWFRYISTGRAYISLTKLHNRQKKTSAITERKKSVDKRIQRTQKRKNEPNPIREAIIVLIDDLRRVS